VLGHSVGAGAALFEATRNPDIAAVISIGAFAHPAEVTQHTLRRLYLPRFVTLLVIRYVEWVIGHRFEAIAPVNTVCRITCPVLLVHGREDHTVPVEDARCIAARCRAPNVRLLEIAVSFRQGCMNSEGCSSNVGAPRTGWTRRPVRSPWVG
jgi:uncharacterized protein